MKINKTFSVIAWIFTVVLLAFLPIKTDAKASTFTDVKVDHHAMDAVEWAASEGLIGGYPDGTFKPNALLTEAQFVAILARYYPTISLEAENYEELNLNVWSNSTYEALSRFEVPMLGYGDYTYRNKPISRGLLAQVLSYVNGQSVELESAI